MLGSTLHRYRDDAKYLLIDTEFEGLNMAIHRPWQVAYALANNKGLLSPVHMSYIRWPDLRITAGAARVSRFDPVVYAAQARDAGEVSAELEGLLYDPTVEVVWQNGLRADVYSLRNWRRALGLEDDDSYLLRSIDVDALSKAKIKGWTPDVTSPAAWLSFQYRAANYIETGLKTNLKLMGEQEQIEHDYDTLHDAASDILLMFKVFQKRLWQVEF